MGLTLFRYWMHRLQHKVPFLWELHSYHHGVTDLRASNLLVSHPIDYALRNVLVFTLLGLIGFNPFAILIGVSAIRVTAAFSHCGGDVKGGLFNYIFVTPEVHRWHHAAEVPSGHKYAVNYGVGFVVWDLIFGTFHLPQKAGHLEQPERLGHPGGIADETNYLRLLLVPLGLHGLFKKATVPVVALILALSVSTVSMGAQQEQDILENMRLDEQRRNQEFREIQRDSGQDSLERHRRDQMIMDQERGRQQWLDERAAEFWAARDAKDTQAATAARAAKDKRNRLQSFQDNLRNFQSHARRLYLLRIAPMWEKWARQLLEQRSRDLEESAEKLREYIDRGTDAPAVKVAPLLEETVYQRLGRLGTLTNRLIPNLQQLEEGEFRDLDLLNQVRDDLGVCAAEGPEMGRKGSKIGHATNLPNVYSRTEPADASIIERLAG